MFFIFRLISQTSEMAHDINSPSSPPPPYHLVAHITPPEDASEHHPKPHPPEGAENQHESCPRPETPPPDYDAQAGPQAALLGAASNSQTQNFANPTQPVYPPYGVNQFPKKEVHSDFYPDTYPPNDSYNGYPPPQGPQGGYYPPPQMYQPQGGATAVYPPPGGAGAAYPPPATGIIFVPPDGSQGTVIKTEHVESYIGLSIFSCLCCCWCIGLAAICSSCEYTLSAHYLQRKEICNCL